MRKGKAREVKAWNPSSRSGTCNLWRIITFENSTMPMSTTTASSNTFIMASKKWRKINLHLAVHRKALNVMVVICNKIHHSVCMCSELFHIQGLAQPGSSQCFSSPATIITKRKCPMQNVRSTKPYIWFLCKIGDQPQHFTTKEWKKLTPSSLSKYLSKDFIGLLKSGIHQCIQLPSPPPPPSQV